MAALIYADLVRTTRPGVADTTQCWALAQVRYMMGDAGRSLMVGIGADPPQRTQDRAAGCPRTPRLCNVVSGLMSPDPDGQQLTGALVQGSGLSDNFMDVRNNDAAWVGIENNAGFTGALAGTSLLKDDMWETCLQQSGIVRHDSMCGSYISL